MLKKLVEYRETHNLTQAELANILGVTRESLYRWIAGKVKLRASNKRTIQEIDISNATVRFSNTFRNRYIQND